MPNSSSKPQPQRPAQGSLRPRIDKHRREDPPPELMDGDDLTLEESEQALADLARVNRRLLGYGPVIRTLLPRLRETWRRRSETSGEGTAAPIRLLDVGTGSGDVVQVLADKARAAGMNVQVIGLDSKLRHLLAGRRAHPEQPHRRHFRVVASADALPFADGSVDWSLSTLFFHHFGSATNRRILDEMRRVARTGAAVVDLRASRWLRRLIGIGLRLGGAGPVATTDGHLSAASAWSPEQVRALIEDSEPLVELRHRFPFRFSLILRPGSSAQELPSASDDAGS
ncbi:MAG: methyltransferase domain-containing protein [Acidobacteriota bacterium]|nr:methyltransferase domain-containing protein [Acidobacteriota bacterium]